MLCLASVLDITALDVLQIRFEPERLAFLIFFMIAFCAFVLFLFFVILIALVRLAHFGLVLAAGRRCQAASLLWALSLRRDDGLVIEQLSALSGPVWVRNRSQGARNVAFVH